MTQCTAFPDREGAHHRNPGHGGFGTEEFTGREAETCDRAVERWNQGMFVLLVMG